MPQMNECAAEKLDPVQAAELVRVIDLQARWENLRGPIGSESGASVLALHGRQKAYEAFRTRLVGYTTRFRAEDVPDATLNTPTRVVAWCRVVRAILGRAEREPVGDPPVHLVAKAHRLADRLALLMMKDPIGKGPQPDNLSAAIRDLDEVITWCGGLVGPSALAMEQTDAGTGCQPEGAAA